MAPIHDCIVASYIMHGMWSGLIYMLEGVRQETYKKGRKEGREEGGKGGGKEGRREEERREGRDKGKGKGRMWRGKKGNKEKRAAHNVVYNSFCLFY